MLAIIGGSGLTQLANLEVTHREVMRTPYGDPSGAVTFGQLGGQPVAFLARHGKRQAEGPHNDPSRTLHTVAARSRVRNGRHPSVAWLALVAKQALTNQGNVRVA